MKENKMTKVSSQIKANIEAKINEINEIRVAAEAAANLIVRKQLENAQREGEKELANMKEDLVRVLREEELNSKDWTEYLEKYPILKQAQKDTTEVGSKIKINTELFRVAEAMGRSGKLKNIILHGPTGTGKTTFVQVLGHKLNKPVISINASNGMKEEDIFGSYVLLPNETTGKVEPRFVYGPLIIAMITGAAFVIEEINGAKQSVLLKLNSVLDDLAKVYIKETGETIKAAPGFLFAGTFNPGYAGTRALNKAFENRFQVHAAILEMNETQLREAIKHKISDVTENELKVAWFMFKGILNALKQGGLDGAISVRQMVSMIEYHRADEKDYLSTNPGKLAKSWTPAIKYAVTGQVAGADEDIVKAVKLVTTALIDNTDKGTGLIVATPVIPGETANKLKAAKEAEEGEK